MMNIAFFAIVFLAILSSVPFLYGKNVPKPVWVISLTSAAMIGVILGGTIYPFPANVLAGLVYAGIFMSVIVLVWLPIRLRRK